MIKKRTKAAILYEVDGRTQNFDIIKILLLNPLTLKVC